MFFILSKILLFILQPIVWIFSVLILALISKKNGLRKKLLVLDLILLFVFSNNFLVGKVYNLYEAKYPQKKHYDIGILLGGYSKSTNDNKLSVNERGDRLMQTIYLYKTGVINKILLSGGSGKLIGTESNEADMVLNYLKTIGIPDSSILIDNNSRNTIENAKYSLTVTDKIRTKASILVITSAWHIPRSKMIFNTVFKRKLDYYPTDFVGKSKFDISDYYLPNASALNYWEFIIKEWLGLLVDRFRI